jgi:dTDP-4-dehydrorhamnose 3,5-epimerase
MPTVVEPSAVIPDVRLVHFQKFSDSRGYFFESFRKSWVPDGREMVQGNCSFSGAGVLRGMHYHFKQADFWVVPVGRVRAALFDFRASSPTFRATQVLDMGQEKPIGIYIPKGVAHGFCALEDSYMTYLVDEYYDGADELGIRWDDPSMALPWNLDIAPIVSDRDQKNPALAEIPPTLRPR